MELFAENLSDQPFWFKAIVLILTGGGLATLITQAIRWKKAKSETRIAEGNEATRKQAADTENDIRQETFTIRELRRLLQDQGRHIDRMEAKQEAKDRVIAELQDKVNDCHAERATLKERVDRLTERLEEVTGKPLRTKSDEISIPNPKREGA